MKAKILVVEDEVEMAAVLKDNLEFDGYEVVTAASGREAMEQVFALNPDLVVLDILMPEGDGTQVCMELRKQGVTIPILFLTAKCSEVDRVLGLEIGGDDYLCKPFFMREFLARVKALLRRADNLSSNNRINIGECVIDLDHFSLTDRHAHTHNLSHYEVEILKLLLQEKNRPVSRNQILDKIWGMDAFPTNRTVDNYIVRLRKKLEAVPHKPRHILTIHGVGYKLVL